jgi:hypothetical protein
MIISDFSRRGVPWARLLAARRMLTSPRGLSLGSSERLSAISAIASIASLVMAVLFGSVAWSIVLGISIAGFLAANRAFFGWLARANGARFAFASVPLHLLYSLVAVSALVWGTITYLANPPALPQVRSSRTRD